MEDKISEETLEALVNPITKKPLSNKVLVPSASSSAITPQMAPIIRQLTDIIKAQHEALEWYADDRNYYENPDAILRNTFVGEDRGKRATQALALSAPIVKGE